MNKKAFSGIFTTDTRLHSSNTCHTYCCYAYHFTRSGCTLFTCDMYMCRLRLINDSVLSSLKIEGIRLLFILNLYFITKFRKNPVKFLPMMILLFFNVVKFPILFFNYALQPLRFIMRSGLDVPTFATRRLHSCHQARAPQRRKVKLWARNFRQFCLNSVFHITFRDLLHAVKLRRGTYGFTSPPKKGVLKIFLL
jgi:hypothetical protein